MRQHHELHLKISRPSTPIDLTMSQISPFLHPGAVAEKDRVAVVYLRRDQQLPTVLKERDDDNEGYTEGKVINTRFGSFPHTTLIGLPWGTQVRASNVDTGSRGRRNAKRKLEDLSEAQDDTPAEDSAAPREAQAASSGFVHLLPPTPENWTSSLPHRTQVVYTPDYSYVLHRIRARPGSHLIEAGAGSGSFTHASTRAVYNGYPCEDPKSKKRKLGKVYSYEFHEQRHAKLVEELNEHGLSPIVQITHRDVCGEGFLVGSDKTESPAADSIFLDLPAPWLALPHLSRKPNAETEKANPGKPFVPAIAMDRPVHICTFSPCIEQVQKTVSRMRELGWVDIEMVEVMHKRLEVRRERIGIAHGVQQHGVQNTPATVMEAVQRLKEIEGRFKTFHGSEPANGEKKENSKKAKIQPNSKQAILDSLVGQKIYKEGNLVHKTEPEVKTHTSYLVFAVLPMEWSGEDEAKAAAKWPVKEWEEVPNEGKGKHPGNGEKKPSKRELKRVAKEEAKKLEAERVGGAEAKVVEMEMEILKGEGDGKTE